MKFIYFSGVVFCFFMALLDIIDNREIRIADLFHLLVMSACSWMTLIYGILGSYVEWFEGSKYNKLLFHWEKRDKEEEDNEN